MKENLVKRLKALVSITLVVVTLLGLIIVPVRAATTSTAARIYSDFTTSPAYENYSEFAGLYVDKYSKPIPGLEHTDVNGEDCTTMVPQGICFAGDYLIISAYDSAGSCNSVLYVISNTSSSNRAYMMTIVLATKAHVGGIAFDGTYLWVSNGSSVSSIKYETLDSVVTSAVAAKKKSVSVSFYSTCALSYTASFLTYDDCMLWVGQFKDKGDSSGMMYSYTVSSNASKLTKKYSLTLPDRTQGACFKNGYLILSRSYARKVTSSSYISQLRIYQYSAPASDGTIKKNDAVKVIEMPPMVEGVVAGSNYMYILFESAATKYYLGTDGSGKCSYPTDRYVAFRFSDFIDMSNTEQGQPSDTVYFPACSASEESIVNALSSLGYDSSMENRKKIAAANGISDYTGTAEQNVQLLDLMKAGKLINPSAVGTEAEPATVTLDTTSTTIRVGESVQIGASYTQGTASWKSSNTDVATVSVIDDSTVSVQAVGTGTATITCTLSNGNSASCAVTVVEAATVTLDISAAKVQVGSSVQLTASFNEGSVFWYSGNTNVATVSAVGDNTASVQAVGAGSATITCMLSNGSSASCVVTVEDAQYFDACNAGATSFETVLKEQGYDSSMETRALIANANGFTGYTGTAQEDDALLALMKKGKLVNPGISPVAGEPVSVTLSQTTGDMAVGQKLQLVAFFSEGTVYWKSSNVNVLTVKELDSDTVNLTAVGEGKATITCVLSNGSFAKCVIRVKYQYFDVCGEDADAIAVALDEQNYDVTTEVLTAIAEANGIAGYTGSSEQDKALLSLMREGKLINPGILTRAASGLYFEKCDASFESIALALESIGVDSSKTNRENIAKANDIANYTGTAEQNTQMLELLKAGKLRKPAVILAEGEYLVSFNANGGNGEMSDVGIASGAKLPAAVFTKKGHSFAGWATSETGSVVYGDGAAVTLTGDVTLYAVWTPNEFIVTYNANGGTGTMANTVVTYGVNTKLRTPAFTREGYSLVGWYRYRTSDNKWFYDSADGKTTGWYVEGTQPSGYTKNVLSTTSGVSKTSAIAGDVIVLYAVWKEGGNYASLDGKTVVFIGNSFVYYGGVVEHGGQKKSDKGWFYEICKANGENVTVIDCTYGSHHLYDFTSKGCKSGSCHNGKDLLSGLDFKSVDYVFISESGNNNSNFLKDVKAVMKRFPSSKTKFFYLSHSYTYSKNHKKIINNLDDLEKLGVGIIEWGKLVDDVIDGRVKVSGATVSYNKKTFIKNKGDTYHPNPLAGYITAQMAYCAVTGKTAVGQLPDAYKIGDTLKYGKSAVGYSAYISKHYSSKTSSNFKSVLKSREDMTGLQKLMNKYLAKWNLGVDG